MSKIKHTAGPWKATFNKKFGWWTVHHIRWCQSGETSTIVQVADFQEEKEGNARLIAAAPELLAALEAIVESHVPVEGTTVHVEIDIDFIQQAEAAIAKATGSTR